MHKAGNALHKSVFEFKIRVKFNILCTQTQLINFAKNIHATIRYLPCGGQRFYYTYRMRCTDFFKICILRFCRLTSRIPSEDTLTVWIVCALRLSLKLVCFGGITDSFLKFRIPVPFAYNILQLSAVRRLKLLFGCFWWHCLPEVTPNLLVRIHFFFSNGALFIFCHISGPCNKQSNKKLTIIICAYEKFNI